MEHGIILEGGGMRGIFTCGVLDVLMENCILFDALAGVSAGILFGCNYKSLQPGRGLRYNLLFKDDKRYMSWKSFLETGDYVNTEFAYHTIPTYLDPFDFEAFSKNPMKFYVICTDIVTGKPVYKLIDETTENAMDWFRASASMPIFAKPVELEGHVLLDGGIANSIPLRFLQERGYKKNLVVLTQPKGYRKKPSRVVPLIKLFTRKYPKVAELMKVRHKMYNNEIKYVEQEVEKGTTFTLYPDKPLNIGRIEQNEEKMRSIYAQGRKVAQNNLSKLKSFLEMEN